MHQRPLADPNSKDDLLVPADVSFATMMTNRTGSPAADVSAFVAPDPVDAGAVYHGDAFGSGENHGANESGGRIETTAEGRSAVEFFDDVFGSSPDDHHRGPRPPSGAATASLPTIPAPIVPTVYQDSHRHPSDMNRLEQEHSTSGYRDGLSAGKNATLQAGFDEGYSLGAAIGGVVGELLGLLEALVVSGGEDDEETTSTASTAPTTTEDATGAHDTDPLPVLLGRARRDLTAPSIFSPCYFAADGTWIYDVEASEPAGADTAEAGAAVHTTIFDVANAHPLVKTWRGIVDRQLERRRIRWGKAGDEAALATALGLKDEDESHGGAGGAGGAGETSATDAAPTATPRAPANDASALDW
ncbi:uncharacterized protein SPSK_05395 [Sporothrix schenckii 1099-18]|uniref:Protein YAE1 n=1 Tax=Sporothrix schenckii 1099-18 TaxID=1397361 RepID=A0A0F2LVF2_SPOSC|nr:uncharacterized protein SPSK_05395 [Sporothrix schenckii 1099-18]KJR80834.1 hypothetical protein SPSK_05395 [Sporothrix schenckii 1099-18]